jgi:hypothetical protein
MQKSGREMEKKRQKRDAEIGEYYKKIGTCPPPHPMHPVLQQYCYPGEKETSVARKHKDMHATQKLTILASGTFP